MSIFPIILLSLLLFKNSFSIYFFQDDFFVLSISKIKNIGGFLHFFIPRADVQFYRPLSSEIFYFLGRLLFGLNPIGFHLVAWTIFILNIFLVWKLSKHFLTNRQNAIVLVFLYATSGVHYNSLYWIVNFSYILAAFWYFLGFLVFLKSDNSTRSNLLLSVIYLLGLFSNEFMIAFPIIVFIYTVLFKSKTFQKHISIFSIFFVISSFYLFIRLFIFKPNYGTYHFVFDKSIVSSFRWFVLFFLNWAETMKDQMLNFYKVNPRFLASFPYEFYSFVTNAVIFSIVLFLLPVIYVFKNRKYREFIGKNYKKVFFALLWFIINLVPIIFIPSHISPHQGTIALFGFLLIFFVIFDGLKRYMNNYLYAIVVILLGINWVVSSFATISLDDKVHWIKRRGDLAREWIGKVKNTYPILSPHSIIQIPTTDKEIIVALNGGQGINEIYADETLKIIFSTPSAAIKEVKVVP